MPDYQGPYSPEYYDNSGGYYYGDSGPSWMDLISQGIDRATQAYVMGEQGYPQQPQYPQYQPPQAPQQIAPFTLQPGAPIPQPPRQDGFQISTTMALVLGVVGFAFLFGKRGR